MTIENWAKLACAYSGLVWGLFWIPVRALDQSGISGLWAILLFYIIPFALTLPIILYRWREMVAGGWYLQSLGLIASLGLVLYSVSVLYTDVVRAMLLFYLTPAWSTLLGRLILKESITAVRIAALALALAGMLTIFKLDLGLPWPERSGDWLALLSGLLWSLTSIMLRARQGFAPIDLGILNFIWSGPVALGCIAIAPPLLEMPPLATIAAQLWWLIPVIIGVVMTGVFAAMWGASKLSPGLVGLLFMTEISVGAVTAALWSGDPFGWRELIGIALITGAALLESLWNLRSEMNHAGQSIT